ncbi:kinesin-like protein FLA10 [Penaeus japonicus]|uniref:kinesin-like protein FLA10 n=1 Tax=Penaeus japonicus TaxID=27405 RepID=UPI001C712BA7|nr:kinesin-like protein FLA10 [Penaeus japonicus]
MFLTPATPQVGTGGSSSSNVRVYVRTRPLLSQELENGAENILSVVSSDKQVIVKSSCDKVFKFEDVFDEDCPQEEVYRKTVAPLVAKVQEGNNATVFAYGQTGSGKTYTIGTDPCTAKEDEGLLQRAMHNILGDATQQDENQSPGVSKSKYLSVCFMEVYNETVFDLLAPTRVPLEVKAGKGGGVSAIGMVEEKVHSVEEGLLLLEKGSRLRSVGSTAMNQHSSRSHALIYLNVYCGKHRGCLKLVDLAGAEGVGRAQTSGQQFMEGVAINKGLLTLGKVLAALSNSTTGYVPYRESILTRLLKDSLGGTSHTMMIACVNPASINMYETINTLTYAEQARNIRTRPQVLSTVKRFGLKRRCEDPTATPGAWKRRVTASGKKQDHNTTVSTPGHKVPKRKVVTSLNNTFATPCNNTRDIFSSSLLEASMPPPPPGFPSIKQPIFEDVSPSGISVIHPLGPLDETKGTSAPSFSPMLERVTNRLEQSVMTQLESIEDRVADRIIERLTKKDRRKRKSRARRISKKHKSSTPTGTESEKSLSESDSSGNNVLGASIINAIFNKDEMKSMLQGIVTDALQSTQKEKMPRRSKRFSTAPTSYQEKVLPCSDPRKPLGDVTNVYQLSDTVCMKKEEDLSFASQNPVLQKQDPSDMDIDYDLVRNLPITSTAFVDTRAVRRSTRLSTRQSIHKSLFPKIDKEVLTSSFQLSERNMTRNDFDLSHDTTAIFNNGSSPTLKSREADVKVSEEADNKENVTLTGLRSPTFLKEESQVESYSQPMNITLSSPLQIDRILKKDTNQGVRRSSRFAAIKATQRNFEIYKGQSPLSNMCKSRRSSVSSRKKKAPSSANVTVCVAPTDVSALNETDGKWQLVVSPHLQKQHNDKILQILNTGSLKTLQQLPTVGPKTAMVIHNFRQFYGEFKSVEDLKDVPALPKTYYTRFMKANIMDQLCF